MELRWRRNLFNLWIGAFFCAMAYTLSIPFIPIFLQEDLGIHSGLEAWSGVTFSVSFLASALIAPYWGSLADKYGQADAASLWIKLECGLFSNYFVNDPYTFIVVVFYKALWRVISPHRWH